MRTRIISYTALGLIIAFFISGCVFMYEKNVNDVYSRLKLGMTKSELDGLFKTVKFLKEQAIIKYPNISDSSMRTSLLKDHYYDDLYPKTLFENISLDGNVKVFSYLIKKELNWPNGWIVSYVAIFYDKKSGKVIGWGKISTYGKASTWQNNF